MTDFVLREILQRLQANKDIALKSLEDVRYTHPMLAEKALVRETAWSARMAAMEAGLEQAVFKLFIPAQLIGQAPRLPSPAEAAKFEGP